MRLGIRLVLIGAVASSLTSASDAQVRASEAATVSQTVDGTVITIAYSRPQARGRQGLFGTLVHYDEIWTPGANWATTLEVSKDVRVNGQAVAKGTYSVWAIPGPDRWTMVLDPEARRFHTQRPRESSSQIRFTATPDSGAHTEVLTWDFPAVRRDGATLRLRWGALALPLDIAVQPTGRGQRASNGESYVGTYALRFSGRQADAAPVTAAVREVDGVVHMRLTPNPFEPAEPELELVPMGEAHAFRPAFRRDGRVFDVETEAKLVFSVENGRATGFELFGLNGRPWGQATRAQ